MTGLVRLTIVDQVAEIVLDRVQMKNALSREMLDDLNKTLDDVQKLNVRVIIFSAPEGEAFCSGADLKERITMNEEETFLFVMKIQEFTTRVAGLKVPSIAAIDKMAFGGGLELALACDIRVGHEDALMGLTECAWGIIPGAGGTQRLPAVVGLAHALDLILSAKKIDGKEAYRIGLLQYVTSTCVRAFARNLAAKIKQNAPLSLIHAKEAVLHGFRADMTTGLKQELQSYHHILHSNDRKEGLLAFKEKRPPIFHGR